MTEIARIFITVGIILILTGLGLQLFGKIPGIGRLPGDILLKKENFTFYFPLTTCLLVSLILTILFLLWRPK